MENDVNVTSMTLLTKQWRRRESDAICTPLTAEYFLNILSSINNGGSGPLSHGALPNPRRAPTPNL